MDNRQPIEGITSDLRSGALSTAMIMKKLCRATYQLSSETDDRLVSQTAITESKAAHANFDISRIKTDYLKSLQELGEAITKSISLLSTSKQAKSYYDLHASEFAQLSAQGEHAQSEQKRLAEDIKKMIMEQQLSISEAFKQFQAGSKSKAQLLGELQTLQRKLDPVVLGTTKLHTEVSTLQNQYRTLAEKSAQAAKVLVAGSAPGQTPTPN